MPIGRDRHCRAAKSIGFVENASYVHMDQHRSALVVKMCDEEDVLLASAALIIILSAKRRKFRKRRFWVRPSLQSRNRGSDLMKDLILDDVDQLNLEYRCGGVSEFFFECPVLILKLFSL
ncbi:hypothetical protein ANN_23576 [Periplaneta americana]|uniref:Uncharacterized protein n=1 Tax=Periplaneta americana TaxID=6978 RepID=A0ABQ8SLX3_PERAM|nr:hypothetical protein ANN_23576 [Periplaneta americana]